MNNLELQLLLDSAEADALLDFYNPEDSSVIEKCRISYSRFGKALAIRCDIYPGFVLNKVMCLGYDKRIDQNLINEISSFFKDRSGIYTLQISPDVTDSETVSLLTENGYNHKNNWNRFFRNTEPLTELNTGLIVREIGKEYSGVFSDIILNTFGLPAELDVLMYSYFGKKNWKHFIAFENDCPAAGASLFLNGETAWIGMAATLPEHRNKGAQGALLSARIDAARIAGCKIIAVETAEDNASFRNMLRYGFTLLNKKQNFVKENQ